MATGVDQQEYVDQFDEFFREYYRDEIGTLARNYPSEQKSLAVDWDDLYRYDRDLADQYLDRPEELQRCAEEALRLYDLPIDVTLGQAHVRIRNVPEATDIREIRARHVNTLVAVRGIVRKATDVRPKCTEAAFRCVRCETLTRVPQESGSFQEPHECRSCERQGPFRLSEDQSEFVDAQRLQVQESPEGLRGGETPQAIEVDVEDDITGEVTPGDHVTVTGILRLDQDGDGGESPIFDVHMEGISVEVDEEEFEDMDITEEDKAEILELSEREDVYEQMVGAIAPSIHGYEQAKLAMVLQLFSGVTKHLPDQSRIRGDLHMLLIGDPGTGKCVRGDTRVALGDGTEVPIRELVESNLDDPVPVDDGVYDEVDFEVPSMAEDGTMTRRSATKVWKREAPDRMYRIRTASGRELEVTPSHPLFVQSGGQPTARRAEELSEGVLVAAPDPSARTATSSVGAARSSRALVTDGGTVQAASGGSVGWDRIEAIDAVDPDYEWVYDLEVADTHTYVSEGVVSHNSQLLQYVKNIAPRSVYTSGKGSSSAGLCVTGDTMVHTDDGFRRIRDLVSRDLPEPVDDETAVERAVDLQTYERGARRMRDAASSHVWRMPEKPCRRVETNHGKHLEASVNTPVLTCGEDGIQWTEISDVEPGDYVAVPKYGDLDRTEVDVREFLELTTEKLLLADETIEFLRTELTDEFGTLRDAAAALDLSEDFIYLHLKNRHVPLEKLDRMLDAIDASREDVEFERLMIRHGDGVTIPDVFDEDLTYLLGLVFGDGDISLDRRDGNRGMVRISNGDECLLERAARIFDEQFDKRPEIEYQEDRVPCIRVNSATIARLFANAGMQTPKEDLALDPRLTVAEHADAFLRGLMDADGSVSNRGGSGGSSVLLSTISDVLAEQVQLMLETYGVRARVRERDRRGTYELEDGRTIESKHVQYFVELYGPDVDRYAEQIGFESAEKQAALEEIVREERRQREKLPIGAGVAVADGAGSGQYYFNVHRDDDPGRERARAMLSDLDLGPSEPLVREAVEADLRWDEVVEVQDAGEQEVFDLTVPETHNFVGNGIVTHNTAAAVRDDFGDSQQWTLEAGALVLADQGVAAVDELDKMRCVTGDTAVRLGDGRTRSIGDLATECAETGEIEHLQNGRTIRDVDLSAWTMTDDGSVEERPVTAIHEYEAPDELTKVTLETGETLTATPDHPFFVAEDGTRVERPADDLVAGDLLYVPRSTPGVAPDGGVASAEPGSISGVSDDADVTVRPVESVTRVSTREESSRDAKVYDLTVSGTHNFLANGIVVHNSEDRSAMHEALEQQSISISKAGINATLKSRCSLLGAANPIHGRFDQYEPMGEQIDLEPALISRFDLIFTVTDEPDPQEDAELAEHILQANYAGQLNTQREKMPSPDVTVEEVSTAQSDVQPTIEAELLRKYVAYSQQHCYPRMTDAARERIRDFYVELRSKGADEDAPVPVTARKLEALVRLAEASARVRLADEVQVEDAERVIEIVRSCLQDIGVDPETGQFDADIVETGTSKTQRDRIKNLKALIDEMAEEYDQGVPVDALLDRADEVGIGEDKAERELEKLKQKGEVYEPRTDHVLTT